MPKIFIANHVALDYSKASQFSDEPPLVITKGFVDFSDIEELSMTIKKRLTVSDSPDYLILSGNNLICAMIVFIWLSLHGKCNVLYYSAREDEYNLVSLTREGVVILT